MPSIKIEDTVKPSTPKYFEDLNLLDIYVKFYFKTLDNIKYYFVSFFLLILYLMYWNWFARQIFHKL